MATERWFDVSRSGLKEQVRGRDAGFILAELISNAFDEDGVTEVRVGVKPGEKRGEWVVFVEDNSPKGFERLGLAYTMFEGTSKRDDAERRGRFTIGEKLVLAYCKSAEIVTTKGTITFHADGTRSENTKEKLNKGTCFRGTMRLTRQAIGEMQAFIKRIIQNGRPKVLHAIDDPIGQFSLIEERERVAQFEASLQTVQRVGGDDEQLMRLRKRKTRIDVYKAIDETGWLYEMGIPVCEIDGPYDVDVNQRVPLDMERQKVSDKWLQNLRGLVLSETFELLSHDNTKDSWVRDAMESKETSDDALVAVVRGQCDGKQPVAFTPGDSNANDMALGHPDTHMLLHGGAHSPKVWENIRRAVAAPSSAATFGASPKLEFDLELILNWDQLTAADRFAVNVTKWLYKKVFGQDVEVELFEDKGSPVAGEHSNKNEARPVIRYNRAVKGCALRSARDSGLVPFELLRLIIHECAHHDGVRHVDTRFYENLERLGATLAMEAADNPDRLMLHPIVVATT